MSGKRYRQRRLNKKGYFMSEVLLKDSIAYAENSVVSRIILNKPGGSITAFSLDKDQFISEHTTPYEAFIIIIDGSAEIKVGEDIHKLKEGMSLMMPAGIPHSLKAVEKFKMLLTMIK
jgi:quercetin dioxygenase-like cupin family protein